MVFGFLTRKLSAVSPERVPLPGSPPPASGAQPASIPQVQLRTPSPSIGSSSVVHRVRQSASPVPPPSTPSTRQESPSHPPPESKTTSDQANIASDATPETLITLLNAVPAKILHSYLLAEIPHASDSTLAVLSSFFQSLTPPPRLHCVRCHKDYVEIDNDDRSCLVPHDDESAEVERVGRSTKKDGRRTTELTEYETLWGCCGKTTEGDGNQGPPDGWCYEGKHTTDLKRARFRADSTPHDDKLVTCLRLNCHGIRSTLPRSSNRKRPRSSLNYKEPSSEEDGSEGEADSGVDEIMGKGKGSKSKGKRKARAVDEMDVDENENEEPDSVSRAGSVRSKAKSDVQETASASANKRRGRPPKSKALKKDVNDDSASAKGAPKRRGRQPKSKAYIDDSDEEQTKVRNSGSASPVRNIPRTRSDSRTRSAANVVGRGGGGSVVGSGGDTAKSKPKLRSKLAIEADKAHESDSDQPKKKRKVVPWI